MSGMDHERFEELKELYALRILPEHEHRAFEEYLAAHPERQSEVEDLQSVVNLLALSPPEQDPPPDLRRTLMDAVRDEASPPHPPREEEGFFARLRETLNARRLAAGAAAILIAGLLAWNVALQTELRDARTYEALGTGDARQAQVLRLEDYGPVLVAEDLPPLPRDRTYQIWALDTAGNPESIGLFRSDGGQAAAAIEDSLEGVDTVAVTAEPAGGSEAPTSDPVLAVEL